MQPLPVEHDASLNNIVDFVKETMHLGEKQDPVPVPVPETTVVSDAEDIKTSAVVDKNENTEIVTEKQRKEENDV